MNEVDVKERLKVFLSFVFLVLLFLFYYVIPSQTENKFFLFFLNVIPSLAAVLIGVPCLYFLFNIIGLKKLYNKSTDKLRRIEEQIASLSDNFEMRMSDINLIKSFEEEFYECDWKDLINSSSSHIDIVVYYFDSWINRYRSELINFLKQSDTTITIIVSDPDIEDNFQNIQRLFPDSKEEVLKSKIYKTYTRFINIAREAGADPSCIDFYFYPYPLNYSIQKFDNSKTVVSFFEMFRVDHIKSPVFVLNTEKSSRLKAFFEKEINGLKKNSRNHSRKT